MATAASRSSRLYQVDARVNVLAVDGFDPVRNGQFDEPTMRIGFVGDIVRVATSASRCASTTITRTPSTGSLPSSARTTLPSPSRFDALTASGVTLGAGDCLVVSSKVVSKALGLTWHGMREDAVAAGTVRVVAERRAADGITRVVESVAGPVMAAAGVDASNTGPSAPVLLLPDDPDAEAARLRAALLDRLELPSATPLAVVLSDTAGRPWRDGLTDLALGSAGLAVLEDLRGATDHDGRPLAVTMRAVADEVAAAADLVKGKADGIPAALVRGLDAAWFSPDAAGARALVRVGPGDWFALGHVEAVRAALGVPAGSALSQEVGIRSGAARRAARGRGWAGSWRSPCSTCPRARPTSASTRRAAPPR